MDFPDDLVEVSPSAPPPVPDDLQEVGPATQLSKAAAESGGVTQPTPVQPPTAIPNPTTTTLGPQPVSHAAAPGELSDFQKQAAHRLLGLQVGSQLQDPQTISQADWQQQSLGERMMGPNIADWTGAQ